MKKINTEELKKIQLEILKYVAKFCDENNINYFLDSGTLIGAVRHKGYIPWDDDIDIGMLRSDYDKFMSMFNASNNQYEAWSVENHENYIYPICKVMDKTTVLYELGQTICVNIDIFVYDNAPDNDKVLTKMYDKRDRLRFWHVQRNYDYAHSGGGVRKSMITFVKLLLKFFPKNYFAKKIIKNSQKYSSQSTQWVGNFFAKARIKINKDIFERYDLMEFEGDLYKVPSGYDTWLKAFYGDYMKLPPIEMRVPFHSVEAYFK